MKKLQYLRKIAMLFSIIIMTVSCEDFLDRYPNSSVSGKDIYSNIETAESALIGLYNNLQSGSLTGRMTLLRGDLKGSDFFLLTGSGQYFTDEYNYQENITNHGESGYIWYKGYQTIKDCNNFLKGIKNLEGGADENTIDDMMAQAMTIKSIAYIELIKTFCYPPRMARMDEKYARGLPVIDSKKDNISAIEKGPERAPLNETFAHVEGLLEDAVEMVNPARSTGSFVSQPAIYGLLAEIYLYQEKWEDAASAAEDAASGGSIIDRDDYLTAIREDGNQESLLEIMYTPTDNLADRMPGYWINMTVNEDGRHFDGSRGYGDVGASDSFINLLKENPSDIRINLLYEDKLSTAPSDLDTSELVHGENGYSSRYYYKYIGCKGGSPFLHNTPIIRVPEVLLIAAEAYAEQDQDGLALDYLNQLYAKRTGSNLQNLTGQDLKDEIFKERRRELALEGHNIWDYLRKNRSFTRDDSHFTILSIDPTSESGRSAEYFHKVIAPIPRTEMDANPNLRGQQNPGYSAYQVSD
jgi:hypothetical protein